MTIVMSDPAQVVPIKSELVTFAGVAHPAVIQAAYAYCGAVVKNHYENFPVASRLLPKKFRPAIGAIYAFARLADDFADEPQYQGVRLKKLAEWEGWLRDPVCPTHPVFIALNDARRRFNLPIGLFSDLLTAFRMDVEVTRYLTFEEVLNYCHYSANPVGRLVLHLFGVVTPKNLELSDAVCTALQLANFWQDVAIDLRKNRIYLPQEECERFGVDGESLASQTRSPGFKQLLAYQIERTRQIFREGKPLGLVLSGRLGLEIRLTWLAGMHILTKIESRDYDVFYRRPKLTKRDFARMLAVALSKKRYERHD